MKKRTTFLILAAALAATALSPGKVILNADYTTGQGYTNGKLQFQNGWLGQGSAQVDTTTATVSSVGGPFDRNLHGAGALGGTGGVASTTEMFEQFQQLKITFQYQFTLSADANRTLLNAGIREEGPNAGNGFESAPTQGFKMQYNAFDNTTAVPFVDDGSVKFFPDLNDTTNADAMIVEGLFVGISPGTADGSGADFESDPLTIEYVIEHDGAGGFDVISFSVTNDTTGNTATYSGPAQSFAWASTDAFFAQQLAPSSDGGYTGTSAGVIFEFEEVPEVRPFYDTHFTSAEGYTAGQLAFQQGWVGQNGAFPAAQVDPTGSGTVTSGAFRRNMYDNGLRGGTGGAPAATGDFTPGEGIRVIFDYQFSLEAPGTTDLGAFGFRDEGPNAGNSFASGPQQGVSMEYSSFNDTTNGGAVKFWPDLTDEGLGNINALLISGNEAGIDPQDALGNGVDLASDRLQITYILEVVGDGTWSVESLSVANLDTTTAYCYDGPAQSIAWTALDAFFAQQLMRSGSAATGTVDRVQIDFLTKPEVEATYDIDYSLAQCYNTGKLQFQNGWLGQGAAQVDPLETGTASSVGGPFDRNLYGFGLRGGTGGVATTTGTFAAGESIEISLFYEFILDGDTNRGLVRGGIKDEGPNAGNGFNSTPQEGFRVDYNSFDAPANGDTDGNVKFYPDFGDTDNSLALILEGVDVGIDPGNLTAPDFKSDPLRIDYIATSDGAGNFTVSSFSVTNLATGATSAYTGLERSFAWSATDAFYSQQLAFNGSAAFTGISDRVKLTLLTDSEPEPEPTIVITRVEIVSGDLEVDFTAPDGDYILTSSEDLTPGSFGFEDGPVSVSGGSTGTFTAFGVHPTLTKFFVRVEEDVP